MRDMASRQPSDDVASRSVAVNDLSPALTFSGHVIEDMGKLSLTDNQAVYTGSSHWVTILKDIQHLKDELSEEDSTRTPGAGSTPFGAGSMGASRATRISLLNSAPCLPKEQILAMIPPRKIVDRHVSLFFNAFDMAPFILHRNKFLSEYESFWSNPSAAPITWLGLLSSVMSISAFLQQQDHGAHGLSAVESQDMMNTYRELTIHCLVTGDYLRPGRYTIETLTLHFAVDQNVNLDTSISNWILLGVIIRIALRMGLHRDPSHWPDIRPMQAELRRRLWMSLYQMDFFTSTQVGLPRIINDAQCDTRPPAHLLDDDIDIENHELPPERPSTDRTPLLYLIQRHNIIKVAAEIYDTTEAGPPSPATIATLGAKLERAVEAIPAWLKYRSLEKSIAESPVTILNQMFVDILIHKAVYLLHRRSFVQGSVGDESTKSNELCIKAGLAILEHQRKMNEETQPGGLMFAIRWKVFSSLNHEFLQATMMLCFTLSRFNDGHVGSTLHRREDILEALTLAKGLWDKNADRSEEARRAATAIMTVLQQDSDKSSAPTTTASDACFDQMPGAIPSYFGSFGYEENMAFDPYFFVIDDELTAFGSGLDDFVDEQSHG
ncbi:Fc.00g072390.m01.CDS01 [Cosmosporella sp. VM-42]